MKYYYFIIISTCLISCTLNDKNNVKTNHETVYPDFDHMDTFVLSFNSGNTHPDFFESINLIITEDTFIYSYHNKGKTKFFKGSPGLEIWDKIQPRQELYKLGEDLNSLPTGSPSMQLEYVMDDTIFYFNFYSFNEELIKIIKPFNKWTSELNLPGFPVFD